MGAIKFREVSSAFSEQLHQFLATVGRGVNVEFVQGFAKSIEGRFGLAHDVVAHVIQLLSLD